LYGKKKKKKKKKRTSFGKGHAATESFSLSMGMNVMRHSTYNLLQSKRMHNFGHFPLSVLLKTYDVSEAEPTSETLCVFKLTDEGKCLTRRGHQTWVRDFNENGVN
jgi:hypothetical protein